MRADVPRVIATGLGDVPIRAASDCTCQFDLWHCPKGNCRYSEKASFSCDGVHLPSVGNCVFKVYVGFVRAHASVTWTRLPGLVRPAWLTAPFVPGPALRWFNALRTLVAAVSRHPSQPPT